MLVNNTEIHDIHDFYLILINLYLSIFLHLFRLFGKILVPLLFLT